MSFRPRYNITTLIVFIALFSGVASPRPSVSQANWMENSDGQTPPCRYHHPCVSASDDLDYDAPLSTLMIPEVASSVTATTHSSTTHASSLPYNVPFAIQVRTDSSNRHSSLPVKAIVAGVAGGVVFLAFIGAIVGGLVLNRRLRRAQASRKSRPDLGIMSPASSSPESGKKESGPGIPHHPTSYPQNNFNAPTPTASRYQTPGPVHGFVGLQGV